MVDLIRKPSICRSPGTFADAIAQTAATMTMNSAESLTELFNLATASTDKPEAVQTAELMREVGLKCIGFNGVGIPCIDPSPELIAPREGPSNDQLSGSVQS